MTSSTGPLIKVTLSAGELLRVIVMFHNLALHLDLHEVQIIKHDPIESGEIHVRKLNDGGLKIHFLFIIRFEPPLLS